MTTLRRPRPGAVGRDCRQRGAALLAALWFVAAVSALAVAFSRLATADRVTIVTQAEAVRARALAREGLARTVLVLNERGPERPAPRSLTWSLPDGAVLAARIEGEAGKVDLNAAEPDLLEALARAAGVEPAQAQAIAAAAVDWRDEGDAAQAKGGAERREYEAERRGYAPSNRPFRQVAEMRYVLPVDNEAYARMAPHLTVFGGQARPDARAAGPVVRAALGLGRGPGRAGDRPGEGGLGAGDGRDDSAGAGPLTKPAARGLGAPPPDGGPTGTPQPGEDASGGAAAAAEGAGGAGGPVVYTVRLDVRLPGGYETHARAVLTLAAPAENGGGGGGSAAFRVLDWTAAALPDDDVPPATRP